MNLFSNLFDNDLGIDLGTANVRVWAKGKGLVLDEPAVVAVDTDSRKVLATGKAAAERLGGKDAAAFPVWPMDAGRVRNEARAEDLLRGCLAKASKSLRKPRAILVAPGDLGDDRKLAIKQAALGAGARQVFLLEAAMAAAIGAGLPVQEPTCCAVVDIGAGKTDAAMISLAGVVCSVSVLAGANDARRDRETFEQEIAGRVARLLEIAPPELAADLVGRGILLTGGGALISGLDKRIAAAAKLPVRVADDPAHAAIRGAARVLDEIRWLSKSAAVTRI